MNFNVAETDRAIRTDMITESELLSEITLVNRLLEKKTVGKILILLELRNFFIGDTLLKITDLQSVHRYWTESDVDVNCETKEVADLVDGNPFIHRLSSLPVHEVDFLFYDLVFIISHQEKKIVVDLRNRYGQLFVSGNVATAFFSFSPAHFSAGDSIEFLFPIHKLFDKFLGNNPREDGELYLSESERKWAENWFVEKNVSDHDRIVVLIDNTSHPDKLLRVDHHFEMLQYFLSKKNVKVLIFDERKIGKAEFYSAYLADEILTSRILFAEGVALRESLSLLGSPKIKLVFGPSSGLLHCSSAIYRVLLKTNSQLVPPLMLAYACKYVVRQDEWEWWSGSLAKCLLIVQRTDSKCQIELLNRPKQECASCNHYQAELLIDFIETNFPLTWGG